MKGGGVELRGRRRERAAERSSRRGRALGLAGRGREAVEKASPGWVGLGRAEGLRRRGVRPRLGSGVGP